MNYRLRLPGPTAVPERVRQAMAEPMLNHRGPEFRAIFAEVEHRIKPLLGTSNPVLFFACSGTGVMEASLINAVAPGERVLVCVNGQFGERFAKIAAAIGAQVDVLEVEWGGAIDPSDVERRLKAVPYRAVVAVHNESSTGIVADLPGIGAVVRNSDALFIVDSVSGVGGIEMRQDEWGIDILISASQKALMCPPGIGLASAGAKALAVVNRETAMPRFYWDFRKAMANVDRAETPFTPAVALMNGLRESLAMIHQEGLPNVLARHRRLSRALRCGCNGLGLKTFGASGALSDTVAVLEVPEQLDGVKIVKTMYERHRTVIAGSRNKLSGRVIRIGTMGDFTEADILTDLMHLEDTLVSLGRAVRPGTGIAAAVERLKDAG